MRQLAFLGFGLSKKNNGVVTSKLVENITLTRLKYWRFLIAHWGNSTDTSAVRNACLYLEVLKWLHFGEENARAMKRELMARRWYRASISAAGRYSLKRKILLDNYFLHSKPLYICIWILTVFESQPAMAKLMFRVKMPECCPLIIKVLIFLASKRQVFAGREVNKLVSSIVWIEEIKWDVEKQASNSA